MYIVYRPRSREQKVPSSISRLGITVLISIGLDMFNVVCAARLVICRIALVYCCSDYNRGKKNILMRLLVLLNIEKNL